MIGGIQGPYWAIADDFCAGAGGWDLAARARGIYARGIENNPAARATRDAAGLVTIHDDVWTYVPDGLASGQLASPPCQTFSTAGGGSGRRALDEVLAAIASGVYLDRDELRAYGDQLGHDPRTSLVLTPLMFAMTTPGYRWLAWEQVPTVLPVWAACADVLRANGWHVWTGYVHSEQHGAPQTRKRALLLASRDRPVGPPIPTHSRFYPHDPTRVDLGFLPCVSWGEALDVAGLEIVSNYGTGGDPAARGVRPSSQPAATVTSKVDRNKIRPTQFGDVCNTRGAVRDADQPAPTITASADNGNFRFVFAGAGAAPERTAGQVPRELDQPAHTITGKGTAAIKPAGTSGTRRGVTREERDGSARLTVEAAGVLQTFPADYPWQGLKSEQYLQVGNAIPPVMAGAALDRVTGHTGGA